MPHYLITTPAGQIVALRVSSSPELATKDNPYCLALLHGVDQPTHLNLCPHCGGTNTGWDSRHIPSRACYRCDRKWSLSLRRDKPDLAKLQPGLTNRQKAQALYRAGYTAYQIFPALRVTKQAVYKYLERIEEKTKHRFLFNVIDPASANCLKLPPEADDYRSARAGERAFFKDKVIGPPMPEEGHSAETLASWGMIGIYD